MVAFNLAQFSKAQSSAAQTNVDDLLRNAPLFIHTIQPREKTQNQINSKICTYVCVSPNVGRVAQRKKKFNQFYCLIMILGCKRNSKFPKVKKNLKPYWRAGGTQAENSAIFWLNWLCVSGAISKMA